MENVVGYILLGDRVVDESQFESQLNKNYE